MWIVLTFEPFDRSSPGGATLTSWDQHVLFREWRGCGWGCGCGRGGCCGSTFRDVNFPI